MSEKVLFNGVEYEADKLSADAKALLQAINFANEQITQLNNELAVADTARMAYSNALKAEVDRENE